MTKQDCADGHCFRWIDQETQLLSTEVPNQNSSSTYTSWIRCNKTVCKTNKSKSVSSYIVFIKWITSSV